MKKLSFLVLALISLSNLQAQRYQVTPKGVRLTVDSVDIQIQFYTASTVRVLKAPVGKLYKKESLSVIDTPKNVAFSTSLNGGQMKMKSKNIQLLINVNTGFIGFGDNSGKILLSEKGKSSFVDFNDAGNKTYKVKQSFKLDEEETIYGLGQFQNGKMSQRNQTKNMVQGNLEDFVTFFQSVKGYGIFWDNYSPTVFADSKEQTSFESEVGDCIDYYFMNGGNADGVIAQMRNLTGQVPMFPLWSYGFWQSRERYKSQAELLEVVNKYRELGVPLDGIIQDWQYWGGNYLWNAMEFLNPGFPAPKKMVEDVHAKNAHLIISIWSSFGPHTKPYKELDEKGMLFNFKTWPLSGLDVWPPNRDYPSGVKVYDAYNPAARDIYWKNLARLHNLNIDGWWMDSSEPDHLDSKPEDFDTKTFLGSFRKVRNAYPLMSVGGVYNHQRSVSSDKRVFILTRSAFAGQQRYGANTWSGDIVSSWQSLRNQIPAGLNFSLTGIPQWNADIGGFFSGRYSKSTGENSGVKNPSFQELYVRWLQFGTFTPMMRSHGTDIPREIYYLGKKGEPVYDAIEKFINLRYSLLPYIYSTAWDVTSKQSTFMRALPFDFAGDKNVWDINNQFMFGKSILVCPVVKPQYTTEGDTAIAGVDFTKSGSKEVYLPAGSDWYDYWTGEKLTGGKTIVKTTTLDIIPLYIKAGSIMPVGPAVHYATQKKWDNLELDIYPGANAEFSLYEDELDNYNYEKGDKTEILFQWDDKSRKLIINPRQGNFTGMIINRKFTIQLKGGSSKIVDYNGGKVTVLLR